MMLHYIIHPICIGGFLLALGSLCWLQPSKIVFRSWLDFYLSCLVVGTSLPFLLGKLSGLCPLVLSIIWILQCWRDAGSFPRALWGVLPKLAFATLFVILLAMALSGVANASSKDLPAQRRALNGALAAGAVYCLTRLWTFVRVDVETANSPRSRIAGKSRV